MSGVSNADQGGSPLRSRGLSRRARRPSPTDRQPASLRKLAGWGGTLVAACAAVIAACLGIGGPW